MFTHKVIMKDGSNWGRVFTGSSEAIAYGQARPSVETIETVRGTVEYGPPRTPSSSTPDRRSCPMAKPKGERNGNTTVAQVIVEKEFKTRAEAQAWMDKVTALLASEKPENTEYHYWT